MKITTVGIDLAKNVFQIHATDERDKAVVKKQLKRNQMASFCVNLPPCLVGMEALRQCAPLGTQVTVVRAYRAADGANVRKGLHEDQQA